MLQNYIKKSLSITLSVALLAACGQEEAGKKGMAEKKPDCQPGGQSLLKTCNMKSCMHVIWGKTLEQTISPDELKLGAQVAQETMENGIPGQAGGWKSCSATGSIIPANYYQSRDGVYCREYVLAVHVVKGSINVERHGLACRQTDGIWQSIQEE